MVAALSIVVVDDAVGIYFFFAVALIIRQNFRPWEFCQKMLIANPV